MSNRQIMMLSRCFISSTTIIIILFITIAPTTLFAFQLTSSSTIPYISPTNLHNFLATPTNWPQIVLSSHSVKCPSFTNNRVDIPLREGDYVEEILGLPPLLPLSVVWKCVSSNVDDGLLEFYSKVVYQDLPMNVKLFSIYNKYSTTVKKNWGILRVVW